MIEGISHITFIVHDLEKATKFFGIYSMRRQFIQVATKHIRYIERSFFS